MSLHGKTVLFDLDHVLSDAARRDHLIPAARASDDWLAYHSDNINDTPCYDLVQLLTCFRHCNHPVVGITARPQRWREQTMEWLRHHRIELDELLMHKRDNYEPSDELKLTLAHQRFGAKLGDKILFIIDDHPAVVKAFQKEGVTALMVYGRKYE